MWRLINLMIASMIFFPSQETFMNPEALNLKAEEVYFDTKDKVTLHGQYFQSTSDLCLLFFHGNAGNITMRLPKAKEWIERGFSVFLVDYRGYGKSKGKIDSSKDLHLDAQAALDWLTKNKSLTPSKIILYGESIGAVPSLELASKNKFKAAILEAPFTSLKEMAKIYYGMAPDFMLKDFKMNNDEKIPQIKCPVLIVQGTDDEVVPFEMGKRLFEKAPEPKQFLEIKGAHHNDISDIGKPDFFDIPAEFAKKA